MSAFSIDAAEFSAVWEALAQWADNEASSDCELSAPEQARLATVQAVVERMEAIICANIFNGCPSCGDQGCGACNDRQTF